MSSAHNFQGSGKCDSLENLLSLDGVIAEVGGGFWIKVCAQLVPATADRPDGISYSLTMHRPTGERILGYDNAHPLTIKRGMGSQRTPTCDHRHRRDRIEPYEFRDAETLLQDFWSDVEAVLQEEGGHDSEGS